jgi:hypothetical protein
VFIDLGWGGHGNSSERARRSYHCYDALMDLLDRSIAIYFCVFMNSPIRAAISSALVSSAKCPDDRFHRIPTFSYLVGAHAFCLMAIYAKKKLHHLISAIASRQACCGPGSNMRR